MSNQNLSTVPSSDIITAWSAAQAAHPGVTLDIDGGDRGGWYLTWDHADWDRAYSLCAPSVVTDPAPAGTWLAMVHEVFIPTPPPGRPGTSYPHRAVLTRAGHDAGRGYDNSDDGEGYDSGERTYSWQTLDMLMLALSLVVPADEVRAIAARWVEGQARKMQWALEQALPPALPPTNDAAQDGPRVVIPSGPVLEVARERRDRPLATPETDLPEEPTVPSGRDRLGLSTATEAQ